MIVDGLNDVKDILGDERHCTAFWVQSPANESDFNSTSIVVLRKAGKTVGRNSWVMAPPAKIREIASRAGGMVVSWIANRGC